MTEETQDQVEEVKEEEKPRHWYFTIGLGHMEARVEATTENPSLKAVLADAMGITAGMVFIDEVFVVSSEYWSQNKISVGYHVGANSKAHLLAFVEWTRY